MINQNVLGFIFSVILNYMHAEGKNNLKMIFLAKIYDVSPYDSQRSHPLMNLGVKWDLCVLFVQSVEILEITICSRWKSAICLLKSDVEVYSFDKILLKDIKNLSDLLSNCRTDFC